MKVVRRLLVGGLGIMLALSLIGGVALAGTETATRQHTTLVQGDPYYWVKCEQERLGLCVYAGTEAEAGFRLQIASERLDEAAQLMEQSRFAESNVALQQNLVQIQAMNQAMVSVRERAANNPANNIDSGNGLPNDKTTNRTGWLDPGEIVKRVEQMTQAQLQVLNQFCDGAQAQVREQVRLALEECTRTCTREQVGQTTGNSSGASNQNSNNSSVRQQYQTQEQNQTQEQQRQSAPSNTEPQQQAPQNQPPAPGPADPQSRQGK